MNKQDPKAAADAILCVDLAERLTTVMMDRIGPCFARSEVRNQAEAFIKALMSDLPKRNGWTIAEFIGDRTPDKCQRLLNATVWDDDKAMKEIADFVIECINGAQATARETMRIGALDETGQEKKGDSTAGAKRQHMGCAGGVANGINTVHLSFVRQSVGHALIAHRQWIPEEHFDETPDESSDENAAGKAGIPADTTFATKGQIAAVLFQEMRSMGVHIDFMTGDEVYGSSPDLRAELEKAAQAYVLRVPTTFHITLPSGEKMAVGKVLRKKLRAKKHWDVMSAGRGSKGDRWYKWAWIPTESPNHWILIRWKLKGGKKERYAFHYCYIPEGQTLTKARLVKAAGLRWPVEECFEFGKDYFGLDQSQVRRYIAIRRYTTLTAAALAICAATAALLRKRTDRRCEPPRHPDQPRPENFGMIPLTVGEVKRLLAPTLEFDHGPAHRHHWSAYRRHHQAVAAWYHQRARLNRAA